MFFVISITSGDLNLWHSLKDVLPLGFDIEAPEMILEWILWEALAGLAESFLTDDLDFHNTQWAVDESLAPIASGFARYLIDILGSSAPSTLAIDTLDRAADSSQRPHRCCSTLGKNA
jgi:hypothetical protein